MLSRYSPEIVAAVTNPLTGLPSKLKFQPSIAEVIEACERDNATAAYAREWEARSRAQLAERALLDKPSPPGERERVLDGFQQLKAKLNPLPEDSLWHRSSDTDRAGGQ